MVVSLVIYLFPWVYPKYLKLHNKLLFLASPVIMRKSPQLNFPCYLLLCSSIGQVSARAFAFAFIADTCVVGFLLVSAFFFFHLFLLFRGQTTREWYSSRRPYNLGVLCNLRHVLGLRWYLCWLSPLIPSPLPGDGMNFQVTGPLEPTK